MATKTVTSWKNKKVYQILSPENFEFQEIGETISSDPASLKGRTLNVSLGELTSDRSKNYMNLVFEITDVKGDKAHTRFKKFFIPTGYLRSKVRKRTSKVDYLKDLQVGERKIRVKIMILSRHKISEVQTTSIKAGVQKILDEFAQAGVDKFVQQTLFGKLGTEIYKKIKSVCPIMRVEVYTLEVD
jgi:small subunit ribosomal protein S3Ae